MSLYIASLNSGSNGNCYYIGNDTEAVLIDAGISCRETERRMHRLGLSMNNVKGIFISHEHTDHVNGVNSICKKYKIPVYATKTTLKNSCVFIDPSLINYFITDNPVSIGAISVYPFKKYHDADDPHSFVVGNSSVKVGVFTDLGKVCDQLIYHFAQCNAAFLESNYDADMLANGSYPFYLKRRITNGLGHLSNSEALQLFIEHRQPLLELLILSHLSKNNNCPKLVSDLFTQHAGDTKIVVASRHEETKLIKITAKNLVLKKVHLKKSLLYRSTQMSLFS